MHHKYFKKYYFIDKFNKENIDSLDKYTTIVYRNYSIKIEEKKLKEFRNYCKKKKINLFLSNNIKLAIKLKLDGVYIPSFNKNLRHLSYKTKQNFKIIGSAHNIYEIRLKELQKVEEIFLSSLFKKNKNYLGLNKFKINQNFTKIKIIALGGITNKNIKRLKMLNCIGLAGISYFGKKKGPF